MTRFRILRRYVRGRYELEGWICMNIRQPLRQLTWPIRDFHTWRYYRLAVRAAEQGRWVIRL